MKLKAAMKHKMAEPAFQFTTNSKNPPDANAAARKEVTGTVQGQRKFPAVRKA